MPEPVRVATVPAGPETPREVELGRLRVGDLLAEGGEGRVHLLPRQPHLVLKLYRRPPDVDQLFRLVDWPAQLGSDGQAVLGAATAWPTSVVLDQGGRAAGLLIPRAPRRFSVRHRDGHSRLASLSYLTADPEHRAAAYGLVLPSGGGPERVGVVYALARLLSAMESGSPMAGHGDLSTKNVLWSLQRGPEVYVIDCDSAELFGPDGRPPPGSRRRAMTPNWDDPAVPGGQNPSADTDRYSLALIFLRVVGAANFPIQARQRSGERLEVHFPVPVGPGADALLDRDSPLWNLCARSLSLRGDRPRAGDWLEPLESLLEAMEGGDLMRAVWANQGAGGPSPAPALAPADASEVTLLPEPAGHRERTWTKARPAPRYGAGPQPPSVPATIGYRYVALSNPRANRPNPASAQPRHGSSASPTWVRPSSLNQPWNRTAGPLAAPPGGAPGSRPPSPWLSAGASAPIWPELREQLGRFVFWWVGLHRALWATVTGQRRSQRFRRVMSCLVVDFVIMVLAGASLALIVSPILQS